MEPHQTLDSQSQTDIEQFEPAFDFTSDESSVLLDTGTGTLHFEDKTIDLDVEVRLDLLRIPRIVFYASGSLLDYCSFPFLSLSFRDSDKVSFFMNNEKIEGFLINSLTNIGFCSGKDSLKIKWGPSSEPFIGIGDDLTMIDYVIFHVFNFPNFFGTKRSNQKDGNTTFLINHINLISDEWEIEIKSLTFTEENSKKLNSEGGYKLTHVGRVKRSSNKPFLGKDVNKCLVAISGFLSFAQGMRCFPVCAVGFNGSEERVWESWSSPKAAWTQPLTWFDHHHGIQLQTLFPLFMKKWTDNLWHDSLSEIIHWYLQANDHGRGIDAGIILAQTAIERLSFEFSVNAKHLIWKNSFKDLKASDKFRMLFSSLDIPLDIPTETPKILQMGKKINWLDAPHALTEIRNSLVHPESERGKYNEIIFEAWKLSLWYLEMSILAICGYTEKYGNCLKERLQGEVEDVPWKHS